jgi:hypothetical protein
MIWRQRFNYQRLQDSLLSMNADNKSSFTSAASNW